jgi:hypothetical protein
MMDARVGAGVVAVLRIGRGRGGLAALALAALVACEDMQAPVAQPNSPAETVPQVSEPPSPTGPTPIEVPKRSLGESCDEGASCESGICLKVDATVRLGGSVCSRRCDAEPCPAGWLCAQVFPVAGYEFCAPEAHQ